MRISELFNASFPLEWDTSGAPHEIIANAYDRQGKPISVVFMGISDEPSTIDIDFTRDRQYALTGEGDSNRIMATVMSAIKTYLKSNHPQIVIFSAKEPSRRSLYSSMVKRFSSTFGYKQIAFDMLPPNIQANPYTPENTSGTFVLVKQ